MKIGRLTISDRASAGGYEDRSGPEIEGVLRDFFGSAVQFEFLPRPLCNNCYRRRRREAVVLRSAVEVDLDGDPLAFVDMHMPVAVEF